MTTHQINIRGGSARIIHAVSTFSEATMEPECGVGLRHDGAGLLAYATDKRRTAFIKAPLETPTLRPHDAPALSVNLPIDAVACIYEATRHVAHDYRPFTLTFDMVDTYPSLLRGNAPGTWEFSSPIDGVLGYGDLLPLSDLPTVLQEFPLGYLEPVHTLISMERLQALRTADRRAHAKGRPWEIGTGLQPPATGLPSLVCRSSWSTVVIPPHPLTY